MNARQLEAALRYWDMLFGRSWLKTIDQIKAELPSLKTMGDSLSVGGPAVSRDFLNLAASHVGAWYQNNWVQAMMITAAREADDLRALGVPTAFDATGRRALSALQTNRLRLVTAYTQQQTQATTQAIQRSILDGVNPREVARDFRDSIGLTPRQERAVANYRRLLQENRTSEALSRRLRDARFDGSIEAAGEAGKPLSEEHIERMVARYRERSLKRRAESIARTESLRALNAGQHATIQQAVDDGSIPAEMVVREWKTARDERVRPSHAMMNGQKRGPGEPFVSGLGNLLLHPGDESAPGEDTIECRCVVVTRLDLDRLIESKKGSIPAAPAK